MPEEDPFQDAIAASLRALADRYEKRLEPAAVVERTDFSFGENVTLRPTRPGAEPVSWVDLGSELQFYVGIRGRWELSREPSEVAYIELLCDAVIAGRGYEVSALNRSRVVLRDASGQVHQETGYEGCLPVPLPFWTRWGHRHDFLPYR